MPGWIDSFAEDEQRRRSVPLERYGTTDEIAATVAFLASHGAGYERIGFQRNARWWVLPRDNRIRS